MVVFPFGTHLLIGNNRRDLCCDSNYRLLSVLYNWLFGINRMNIIKGHRSLSQNN